MADITRLPTASAAVKVASIIVHVEEAMSDDAHPLDLQVLRTLVADPEVRAWLGMFDEALLPRKRATDRAEHGRRKR